jgi:hypothetical protein
VDESTHKQNQQAAEYEVGYGRPPEQTRFKRGTSGNPKGRPRSRKNLATVFDAVSSERVPVTENGKRKTITILEVIMKRVAHEAAAGDQRAQRHFMDLYFRLHPEGKQELYGIELMRELGAAAADAIEKEKAEQERAEKQRAESERAGGLPGLLRTVMESCPSLGFESDTGFDRR